MPDITLKNEIGTPIAYFDVDTITVPRYGGGTAVYTFGVPDATTVWSQMQTLISDSTYTKYSIAVGKNKLLSCNYPGFGLWLVTNYDAIKLMDGGYWQYFKAVNGGILFSNSQSSFQGLYFYDIAQMQVTKILETGYNYSTYKTVTGGWLITGSPTGLFYYEDATNTLTKIFEQGNYWTYFITVENGLLISSTGNYGILRYYDDTHLAERVFDSGGYWSYTKAIDDVLIISSASSFLGILVYDPADESITQVYTVGYQWGYYKELEGGMLISGNVGNSGILWYDSATRTITQVYSVACRWEFFAQVRVECYHISRVDRHPKI